MNVIQDLLTKSVEDLTSEDFDIITASRLLLKKFPKKPSIPKEDVCYMCRCNIDTCHPSNSVLCFRCGNINVEKRFQTRELIGTTSILTGGRIKIGYHTALRLLRCGSTVIITTRFARDAMKIYSIEDDFDVWKNRLYIFQVDFLSFTQVEQFVMAVGKITDRVDFLINKSAKNN